MHYNSQYVHVSFPYNFGKSDNLKHSMFVMMTTTIMMIMCKFRSKGVVTGSRGLLLAFWDPLYISGTVKAGNFKFGTEIEDSEDYRKHGKLDQS